MPMIYTVVFVAGFSLMSLEMAVARVLSFNFGMSTYVWTAIIGVIMGGLSLGYWLGGKIVLNKNSNEKLFSLCGNAGLYTAISILLLDFIAQSFRINIESKLTSSLITSILLFTAPSIFMGMVSSFASKLAVSKEVKKGETTGKIFALSTLGSIVGTFLSGLVLIPWIGSKNVLILAGLLLGLFTLFSKQKIAQALPIFLVSVCAYFFHFTSVNMTILMDRDSTFSRIVVSDNQILDNQGKPYRTWRELFINGRYQSGIFTDKNQLVFPYIDYLLLTPKLKKNVKEVLLMGGGGYSFASKFVIDNPSSHLDVVEIDPAVTDTAKKYFNLKNSPQMRITHADARIFINDNLKKYDLVFADVYKGGEPPFHLLTVEAYQKMANALQEDGWLVSNIVSSIKGSNEKYFSSVYKTMRSVFPIVYVFPVSQNYNGTDYINIMLIAPKHGEKLPVSIGNTYVDSILATRWTQKINDIGIVLTDDYAPTEYLTYYNKNN